MSENENPYAGIDQIASLERERDAALARVAELEHSLSQARDERDAALGRLTMRDQEIMVARTELAKERAAAAERESNVGADLRECKRELAETQQRLRLRDEEAIAAQRRMMASISLPSKAVGTLTEYVGAALEELADARYFRIANGQRADNADAEVARQDAEIARLKQGLADCEAARRAAEDRIASADQLSAYNSRIERARMRITSATQALNDAMGSSIPTLEDCVSAAATILRSAAENVLKREQAQLRADQGDRYAGLLRDITRAAGLEESTASAAIAQHIIGVPQLRKALAGEVWISAAFASRKAIIESLLKRLPSGQSPALLKQAQDGTSGASGSSPAGREEDTDAELCLKLADALGYDKEDGEKPSLDELIQEVKDYRCDRKSGYRTLAKALDIEVEVEHVRLVDLLAAIAHLKADVRGNELAYEKARLELDRTKALLNPLLKWAAETIDG